MYVPANVSLIRRNVAKRLKNVAEHQKYHFISRHKCGATLTDVETRRGLSSKLPQ